MEKEDGDGGREGGRQAGRQGKGERDREGGKEEGMHAGKHMHLNIFCIKWSFKDSEWMGSRRLE